MLSKRVFWLTCAAIASWLIWMRLRQRQDEFATAIPQFAPPRTFAPPAPAAPPARQPDAGEEPAPAPPTTDTAPAAAESADLTADAPAAVAAAEAASPSGADDLAEDAPAAVAAAEAASPSGAGDLAEEEISGYCMRCKTKRPIQNAHRETTESGRPAARGTCPICGANMFTFLATD